MVYFANDPNLLHKIKFHDNSSCDEALEMLLCLNFLSRVCHIKSTFASAAFVFDAEQSTISIGHPILAFKFQ
ncbi:hypothetical protein PanWU01x14_175450 [Parasponia andersonii]|uniref:Uncharacterized protein n=1 Tax=Parasponia andersonii TaxID=3476 RepID=A0A2P5C8G3_PARAD|nr:hypothetical protein PanWU01x14_175450 [Parasponia andersonii]